MKEDKTSDPAVLRILREQVKAYKSLQDLLMKERVFLVNMDAERIGEISKEKDTVIMRLRLLEEERIRLIKNFVTDNDISGDFNLKELAKMTGIEEFTVIRSQLLSLLQGIEEINKFNSILIGRSLNYIKTTSSYIGAITNDCVPHTSGTLLSKET
jgi:flagellar biosynthesis/type III secretory pathway chaperone